MQNKLLSIIVPCFNEEESLPLFAEAIKPIQDKLLWENGVDCEIIFVDDGSEDKTLTILKDFSATDKTRKYISFSRNFGKEAAIFAGLEQAEGDFVVLMDADLQDPPALLPEMYQAVALEGFDSAATRRVTRKGEPPIRSFFAELFYKIMNRFSETELMNGARDYRLMNRKFVEALLSMKEYNRFTKGLFGWVGFKTKWIAFENVERAAGETKWSFWGLFCYAVEGMIAFSTVPLTLATILGSLFCLLAFIAMILIIVRKLVFDDPVQGWTSLMVMLLFLSGALMLCVGILGQYIAKIYLEVKKRPIYVIQERS